MATPVGFIGLGALGAPMAANLLAQGFALTVHNRHRDRELPLAVAGATRAATPAAAARGAAVLALCLSDDAAVAAVLLGEGATVTALPWPVWRPGPWWSISPPSRRRPPGPWPPPWPSAVWPIWMSR